MVERVIVGQLQGLAIRGADAHAILQDDQLVIADEATDAEAVVQGATGIAMTLHTGQVAQQLTQMAIATRLDVYLC